MVTILFTASGFNKNKPQKKADSWKCAHFYCFCTISLYGELGSFIWLLRYSFIVPSSYTFFISLSYEMHQIPNSRRSINLGSKLWFRFSVFFFILICAFVGQGCKNALVFLTPETVIFNLSSTILGKYNKYLKNFGYIQALVK